ncbi:MAG: hypothetical protein KatS3mg058_0716 [Roseiflexus sp.]|nr:MAG: hypothetical protein KatS3mg058_0716 [Roseiflexus sp.]
MTSMAALGMTRMRHLLRPPFAVRLCIAAFIPMTREHPALSPRAARGVVHDPLRFLAAFTLSEAKGSE